MQAQLQTTDVCKCKMVDTKIVFIINLCRHFSNAWPYRHGIDTSLKHVQHILNQLTNSNNLKLESYFHECVSNRRVCSWIKTYPKNRLKTSLRKYVKIPFAIGFTSTSYFLELLHRQRLATEQLSKHVWLAYVAAGNAKALRKQLLYRRCRHRKRRWPNWKPFCNS